MANCVERYPGLGVQGYGLLRQQSNDAVVRVRRAADGEVEAIHQVLAEILEIPLESLLCRKEKKMTR